MKKIVLIGITTGLIIIGVVLTLTLVKNASAQVYPSGMVSYWKFDKGSGTTATDSVDANPGTIYGATWTSGKVDGALSFDNNYVSVPNTESLNPSHITLEAWVYPTSYGYYRHIVSKSYYSYWANPWAVYRLRFYENTAKPSFWITVGGVAYEAVSNITVPMYDWTHWVGTYDGETMRIYVNGELVGSNEAPSGPLDYRPYAPLYIGHTPGTNNYYYGKIDEVAIYNRALMASEIEQHYQNGLAGQGYEAALKPNGSACFSASECQSGFCVDGVCSNTACTGLCQSVNLLGNVGTCTLIPAGQDPDNECPSVSTCDGAGGCTLIDADGDGIPDVEDNCPAISNPNQSDLDGDGLGDWCDNCPQVVNLDQTDSNNDGIGDACCFDSDDDWRNPGYCVDLAGTHGDYCESTFTIRDYYCTGIWDGHMRTNIHCEAGGYAGFCTCKNGGCCDDTDKDGVCNEDDNCPAISNPDQADADNDGIGNACDNCWYVLNPYQEDTWGITCPAPPYYSDPKCGDACELVELPLDIKPQSCPNPLNVQDKGVLPVAILGTADFNANQIDLSSIRLEGVSSLRSALEDVATPFVPFVGEREANDCTTAGRDGFMDLTLKFDNQAIVSALSPITDKEVRILKLTGNLKPEFGGISIVGEDVVVILKKK